MATLRGSKDILIDSVIESINIAIGMPDSEIRLALSGIIMFLQKERNNKKARKQKS